MNYVKTGTTDRTVLVFIPDSAQTDGSGKTGLVAANLTVSYTRVETDNDVTVTDVSSSMNNLSTLTDAHNDWGWLEVSSTLAPGLYRLDVADAVFATGAWYACVYVEITTSAASPSPMLFSLVPWDPLDTVRLGLTALPNAAAEASGGLYTRGTGAGQINQDANGRIDANVTTLAGSAIDQSGGLINANVKQISTDATAADNCESFFDGTGYAGTNNVIPTTTNVTNAVTLTAAYDAAKTAATQASVDAVDDFVDTEVAAIKAKTDQLTFGVANTVNANIEYVNTVQVVGDGGTGTEWGPV